MIQKIKWFIKDFEWMRVYFSPFKPPKLKWYFGKVALGTPYFLPRIWKNYSPKQAIEKALIEMKEIKEHNSKEGVNKKIVKSFGELYERYLKSSYACPKKIGFDFVPLYWKTKWKRTDYRHESSPRWSFVCFGYQLAVSFLAIEDCHFWEIYLFYSRETKGKTKDRIEQCKKEFPQNWTRHSNGVEEKIDYYNLVLKKKWINN